MFARARPGLEQPDTFSALLQKKHGARSEWEYPFAIAGVNITYMLIDTLGILPVALGRSKNAQLVPCGPFLRILQTERRAFALLYALTFSRLDREWVQAGASYMQFNGACCSVATDRDAAQLPPLLRVSAAVVFFSHLTGHASAASPARSHSLPLLRMYSPMALTFAPLCRLQRLWERREQQSKRHSPPTQSPSQWQRCSGG